MTVAILVIVAIGLVGFAVYTKEAQPFSDWLKLRDYQPPADIATLASQTTMTNLGKHLFYINHPVIEGKGQFGNDCPNNGGEQTIVLGCYHGVENGIFLFQVTDPTLEGVEQVTAAHEMLHAAYDRLSKSERNFVDSEVEYVYEHDVHDPRILSEIAGYKRTEPTEVENEMHSVFGTEVANLPAPLENYYKQYFTNREAIVNFANQYQAKFTADNNQVAAYDQQLSQLGSQISTNEATLNGDETGLNQQKAQLSSELAKGDVTDYNQGVGGYNAAVVSYNSLINATRSEINQYNQIVQTRNALATQYNNLTAELNSNLPSLAGN